MRPECVYEPFSSERDHGLLVAGMGFSVLPGPIHEFPPRAEGMRFLPVLSPSRVLLRLRSAYLSLFEDVDCSLSLHG